MDNKILRFSNFLLELLFPSFCLGCQKEGSYLCQDCKSTLDISYYNYCLCNKSPARLPQAQMGKCQRCRQKKLDGLYFALPYKEKLLTRKLIYNFKYPPRIKNLSKTLAGILIEHFILTGSNTQEIWQNGLLIPIPMEKSSLKDRGYNQAEELAKQLSQIIEIPLVSNNLIKIKSTPSQTKLSAQKREENIKGAFIVKNPGDILGKKVFLVDDVYTTGSTMEECANVLRTFGVKEVWGIAIAREG